MVILTHIIIVHIVQHLHITIIIITGTDISIAQQHIHIDHTQRRINQVVDTSEVINQVEAAIDQVGRVRELVGQEVAVQEQVLAADANNDRKIKK